MPLGLASLASQLPGMVATIGPHCSGSVKAAAEWRSTHAGATKDSFVIISPSSTASSLADGLAYPHVVRTATPERYSMKASATLVRSKGVVRKP